nr:hypothetical protein [Tanacetum cinerariifolium]
MSDSKDSTVTYTEASPSPDYVPGPEHPPSPAYVPGFVSEPIYSEFMPPKDVVLPAGEQPLPAAVSPTSDSPGYILEFDPEEDPKEDLEEDPEEDDEDQEKDPTDYPIDREDDEEADDESSGDNADDEEVDEDKDEEEEHLAPTDSTEVARLLAIPTLSPSPLSPWSSPLPQMLSPPLRISPPPLPASPTFSLGYRAAMIRLRDESPSTSYPLPLSTPPSGTPPLLPIPLPTLLALKYVD